MSMQQPKKRDQYDQYAEILRRAAKMPNNEAVELFEKLKEESSTVDLRKRYEHNPEVLRVLNYIQSDKFLKQAAHKDLSSQKLGWGFGFKEAGINKKRGRPQKSKLEGNHIFYEIKTAEIPQNAEGALTVCSAIFRLTDAKPVSDWEIEWDEICLACGEKPEQKQKKRIKNCIDRVNQYVEKAGMQPLLKWKKGRISRCY